MHRDFGKLVTSEKDQQTKFESFLKRRNQSVQEPEDYWRIQLDKYQKLANEQPENKRASLCCEALRYLEKENLSQALTFSLDNYQQVEPEIMSSLESAFCAFGVMGCGPKIHTKNDVTKIVLGLFGYPT
jgi:hypothetical protein